MKQSKELTKFYKEWLKWYKEGCPLYAPYSQDNGLCAEVLRVHGSDCLDELQNQFKEAKLSKNYPFNGTLDNYCKDCNMGAQYNFKRLDWVIQHAKG